MPRRLHTVLTNFSSGELNPLLSSRTDSKAYFEGTKSCRNFALLAEGGVMRRPGTTYLASLPAESRLMPFVFSEDEVAILAFSDGRLDVYNTSGTAITANITSNCNWTTAQLFELNFTQFGDTVFVVHRNNAIRKIYRASASSFTVNTFSFATHSSGYPRYQPYYKYEADAVTIATSGTSGSVTVTASTAIFSSDWIGVTLRYGTLVDDLAVMKEMDITGFTDTTHVTATVRETLAASAATQLWDEQTFSTLRKYPQAAAFHQNRLYFGGAKSRPAGIFGSKVGEYFNFDVGTAADSDAIDVDIAGEKVNEVRHITSTRNLQVFTDGGEYFIPTTTSTAAITPATVTLKQQTPYGISRTQPQTFDQATIFAQKTGKVVREYIFNDLEDGYNATSVSILAAHLIDSPKQIAVQSGNLTRPEQYAFFLNGGSSLDGTLAVFHSVRNEKIAGWTLWSTRDADKLHSLISLNENLIACVKRVINSSAATCTITVTDYTNIATGATLVLTKNDGTTVTFTCQGAGSGTPDTDKFFHNESNDTTADNIFTCINLHADFSAANPAANVVTVTRAANGGDNLTVTSSDTTRLAVTDFTGGTTTVYTLEKFGDDDSTTLDCQTTSTLNQRGTPLVKGASQTGTSLIVDGLTSAPAVNEKFTVAGHATEYTIQAVTDSSGGEYSINLDASLAATPADNAVITFTEGHLHTMNAIYYTDTVNAVVGNSSLGSFTISSNQITLTDSPQATGMKVGYNFTPTLETMPIDKELPEGPLTGKPRRISRAIVDLNSVLNMTIKAADRTSKSLVVQQLGFTIGSDLTAVTEKKEFYFLGYDKSPTVSISQTDPLPMKVLGMALEVVYA